MTCFSFILKVVNRFECCKPNLGVFYAFVAIHIVVFGMSHLAAVEMLQDEYGANDDDKVDNTKMGIALSLIAFTGGVTEFLANPVWGHLSDLIGRRPIIVFASFFWTFTPLIIYFSPNLTGVLLAQGIGALFHPHIMLFETCLYDLVPDEDKRAQYFGFLFALLAVAFVIGMIAVSVFLIEVLSWAQIFFVVFALGIVQFLFAIFFYPETNDEVWIKLTGTSYRDDGDRNNDDVTMEDLSDSVVISGNYQERNVELLEDAAQKAHRNPFQLVASLKYESPKLRLLIALRLVETFCHAAWVSSAPIVIEELYGWKIHQMAPYVAGAVVLMFISNMTLKIWENCFTKITLFKLALFSLLLQRLLRAFLVKNLTILFIIQMLISFPFGDIFTALNVAIMTDQIDPKEKGRILGAVQAASMMVQTMGQSFCPGASGYFVSDNAPIYYPTMINAVTFLMTLISVYLFYKIFYGNNVSFQKMSGDELCV